MGCTANKSSKANSDGTWDYCIFQINQEPAAAKSLDTCIRRAYEKYTEGRIGKQNWSAFYAVCIRVVKPDGTEGTPIPKYPNIISNCA
jgi:hypothetical protein